MGLGRLNEFSPPPPTGRLILLERSAAHGLSLIPAPRRGRIGTRYRVNPSSLTIQKPENRDSLSRWEKTGVKGERHATRFDPCS